MLKKLVELAHSPDADDIFMYAALELGILSAPRFSFKACAKDIQTLNEDALRALFDVCAISFALYPKIAHSYSLLRTAISYGQGYGPKLIKKKDSVLKRNFKVALSGEHTTNALLFRLIYKDARIVYKNFLDIEAAVLSGEVEAGVLIHESILDFDSSLCVEREIWDIWQDLSLQNCSKILPLPLGGMAIRRSLPLIDAIEIEELLTKAVELGVKHKKLISKMLLERNRVRVDKKSLDIYLNLYANEESSSLSEVQLEALDLLFALGHKAGFYKEKIEAKNYLIPKEYKDLRYE